MPTIRSTNRKYARSRMDPSHLAQTRSTHQDLFHPPDNNHMRKRVRSANHTSQNESWITHHFVSLGEVINDDIRPYQPEAHAQDKAPSYILRSRVVSAPLLLLSHTKDKGGKYNAARDASTASLAAIQSMPTLHDVSMHTTLSQSSIAKSNVSAMQCHTVLLECGDIEIDPILEDAALIGAKHIPSARNHTASDAHDILGAVQHLMANSLSRDVTMQDLASHAHTTVRAVSPDATMASISQRPNTLSDQSSHSRTLARDITMLDMSSLCRSKVTCEYGGRRDQQPSRDATMQELLPATSSTPCDTSGCARLQRTLERDATMLDLHSLSS